MFSPNASHPRQTPQTSHLRALPPSPINHCRHFHHRRRSLPPPPRLHHPLPAVLQQHSPDSRLHASLRSFPFHLTPELFLRVCNNFPLSWRPIHPFYQFTLTRPDFPHSSLTLNKLAEVIGKSQNVALFWEVLQDMARRRLANEKTFKIALTTLAHVRELKKCEGFFHLMNENGWGYSVETLNMVVECLCRDRLVEEAKYVVFQLKDVVRPDGVTYGWLIRGFCDAGDLIEASKVWNLMVDEGLEPEVWAFEAMMERFFKSNRYDEAMKLLGDDEDEDAGSVGCFHLQACDQLDV